VKLCTVLAAIELSRTVSRGGISYLTHFIDS
jgi:hypothetical protein